MLKRLLLLSMMLLLVGFAFAVRDVSTPVARSAGDSDALLADDGDDGDDTPPDPAHAMEEAVNIYIHVILQEPVGPPPPEDFEILSIDTANIENPSVILKAPAVPNSYGGDRFNLYREYKWPMYFKSHVDSADYISYGEELWLRDEFTDPFWPIYGGKGIWDPDINYFYVATTVDSNEATGEVTESAYPSRCVCEYDQFLTKAITGYRNILSYPCDHDYSDLIEIGRSIPGVDGFSKWNAETQSWVGAARRLPTGTWLDLPGAPIAVEPGDVFAASFGGDPDPRYGDENKSRFTTWQPGHIAEDRAYLFKQGGVLGLGWNWIMLPMKHCRILKDDLVVAPDNVPLSEIGADIGLPCKEIRVWSTVSQTMIPGARYLNPAIGWIGTQKAWPGRVVAVGVEADFTEPWPPTAEE